MNTSIDETIATLRAGKAAIVPTDTVYGLGVSVRHAGTLQEIYDIKQRDASMPIAWLVDDPGALDEFGRNVSDDARRIAREYWPGPMTIIVEASEAVPEAFRSQAGTIGLRMPDNPTVLGIIKSLDSPLAVSSANISGSAAPISLSDLDPALLTKVAALAWDDEPRSGIASSVVDCTKGRIDIIRKGAAMAQTTFSVPFSFRSSDGVSQVNAKLWTSAAMGSPDVPGIQSPKAVIQIVHGMSEHIERYDEMACWFAERGFVVCASDLIGHGGTVTDDSELGHIPLDGGLDALVEDTDELRKIVSGCYPDTPYVMYGHSMGSFIVRVYLARHGEGLAAAILSGTANPDPKLPVAGKALASFQSKVRGERHRSKLVDNLGVGAYAKQVDDARTPFDWLSFDEAVVDDYIADPKSGVMFTVSGYAVLLDMLSQMVSPECAEAAPKDTALLFVSGADDPVSDFGKAVWAAAKMYRDAGVEHVTERVYPGMRHEIHKEPEKETVFDDTAAWIEQHIGE